MGGRTIHPQSWKRYVLPSTSSSRISSPRRLPALNEAKVEIRIQFKDVTQGIFKDISRNELVLRIQPSEAVYLKLNTKMPGLDMQLIPTEMDLTYQRRFAESKIPEAYEALILDALKGDHSNFVRDDELDVAWKVRGFFYVLH
jgi:glucose-6-phosphate 1-dehydrogenase